jgi:hypothetical protein
MIGILWAVWHLTNFFIQGAPQEGIPLLNLYTILCEVKLSTQSEEHSLGL